MTDQTNPVPANAYLVVSMVREVDADGEPLKVKAAA